MPDSAGLLPQRKVGGRKAEVAAALVAVRDASGDRVRAAEQRRARDRGRRARVPRAPRSTSALVVDVDRAHALDAERPRVRAQHREVARASLAEAEVVADQHPARVELRTSTSSMNASGVQRGKRASKRATNVRATPNARNASSFVRSVVSRGGAASRAKNSRGCGSNVSTAGGRRRSSAASRSRVSIAWWPRCTPSKLPIVSAIGASARAGSPR